LHQDPFDRLLIWQAMRGDFTLISKDAAFAPYQEQGLRLLW
jgi:PIN domain nuclease of toxin-antitoxin system